MIQIRVLQVCLVVIVAVVIGAAVFATNSLSILV